MSRPHQIEFLSLTVNNLALNYVSLYIVLGLLQTYSLFFLLEKRVLKVGTTADNSSKFPSELLVTGLNAV